MKKIRVYDRKGDFFIEVPDNAEVTFGYFNPAVPAVNQRNAWSSGPGAETMKTTALRIYEMRGKKKVQIATFLGVDGFREENIKLTRIRQRMIVEQSFSDDGEGTEESHSKTQRQLIAAPEEGTYQ